MADYNRINPVRAQAGVRPDYAVDEGLRTYMLSIYNHMALGLVVTGLVAYFLYTLAVTTDPATMVGRLPNGVMLTAVGAAIYTSWLKFLIMFAPLIVVFVFASQINRMSLPTAQFVFYGFSALMGASLSWIFAIYKLGSISQVFFITAASFGALSLWGYTTKKDLSGWGSFLFMGLVGIILASLVNIIMAAFFGGPSAGLQFVISVITVLVFAGLTAYDTQRLKDDYYTYSSYGEASVSRIAIMGALSLYLNFINMFMALLSLLGDRR